jgi:hypothetical protein
VNAVPTVPVAVSGLVITGAGGTVMVNVTALDAPPPGGGFTTVTEAVPGDATSAAVTVAVSCVDETNVVVKAVPFQRTVEPETKFVPFTVMVNCPQPVGHELGLSEVIVGTGLLMVKVTAVDVLDGGPGFVTVTGAVPAVATRAAGTIAVSWVAETYVVTSPEPFQLTTALLSNNVPLTVKVNCGDPARHELGLIELIVGVAATALLAATNTTRNGRIFLIGKS